MSAQLQTPNGHTPPAVTTSEPPRATARFISPNGVSWLVTCPAPTVAELLDRLDVIEARLLARHWTPAEDRPAFKGNASPQTAEDPLCPTHNRPMKMGKGGSWYCPVKVADDDGTGRPVYCKQRKAGQS